MSDAYQLRCSMFADQVCVEQGYEPGSRKEKVAGLASEIAHGYGKTYGAPKRSPRHESVRDYERRLKRERKQAYREFRDRTQADGEARIRANPQAYGFSGIELLFLGWLISGIISAICRKLFDLWWGKDTD